LGLKVDGSGADGVGGELTEVQNELKALADEQREGLNARLNALQSNSAVVLNQTLSTFLEDVRQEAEDNISRRTPTIHRVQPAA
jgi:F0F1-type ATP synthase membrane subunit b/b'